MLDGSAKVPKKVLKGLEIRDKEEVRRAKGLNPYTQPAVALVVKKAVKLR